MKVIYNPDRKKLDTKAVNLIEDSIKKILAEKDEVVLGVCGGTSVSGIFSGLKDADIDWEKVHIFMVDERFVISTHPDSNYRLAYKGFIEYLEEKGKLPQANAYPLVLREKDEITITKYQDDLLRVGGKYDIVLLSSGEDGHIGALYPSHDSVKDENEGFLIIHDSPKPPPDRMTMSRKLLLKSQVAVLLFYGEGKKEAYQKFGEDGAYEECPARLVKKLVNSYVLTDQKPD